MNVAAEEAVWKVEMVLDRLDWYCKWMGWVERVVIGRAWLGVDYSLIFSGSICKVDSMEIQVL